MGLRNDTGLFGSGVFSRATRPSTEPGSADPGPHLFCAILQKSFAFLQNGTEGGPSSPLKASVSDRFVVRAGIVDLEK